MKPWRTFTLTQYTNSDGLADLEGKAGVPKGATRWPVMYEHPDRDRVRAPYRLEITIDVHKERNR